MARKRAHRVPEAQQRRRAKAEQVTHALDDLGYLAPDAYRPHVARAIHDAVWGRKKGRG